MAQPLDRIATAPTSWGLCEVPGWGVQLPPERVLPEMRALGFDATEAGPDGYLGSYGGRDPRAVAALRPASDRRLPARRAPRSGRPRRCAGLGDSRRGALPLGGRAFLVSAVVVDLEWSTPHALSQDEWARVFDGLARIDEIADAHGLAHVVHPHWGTLIERRADVWRVLEGCDVRFCLDTGHLALGETDPAEFAAAAGTRVAHVHLKDIDDRGGGAAARRRARSRTGREGGALPAARRRRRAHRRDGARARGCGVRRLVRARAGHLRGLG